MQLSRDEDKRESWPVYLPVDLGHPGFLLRPVGEQQGRQEGHLAGRLEGERAAVLSVLKARGLKMDDVSRRRIEACTQVEQLEQWLLAAVTVQSLQELFQAPSSASSRKTRAPKKGHKARGPRSPR